MSIGSPLPFNNLNVLQPTVDEKATTANAELAKIASNLSTDSMVSFTKLSEHTLYKYDTPAQQPKLTSPLQIRSAGPEVSDDREKLNAYLNSVLSSLPPQIQEKLAEMHRLTPEQRNPESFDNYDGWRGFEKIVQFAAQVNLFIDNSILKINDEKSREAQLFNSELPSTVTDSMAKDLELLKDSFKEDLKNRLNNPQNDAVRYLVTNFDLILSQVASAKSKGT